MKPLKKIIFLFLLLIPVTYPSQVVSVALCQKKYKTEIVNTIKTRNYGLMNRDKLDPSASMLFIFKTEKNLSFWMKNTRIPLGIIYFDSKGNQVKRHKMNPQPGTPDDLLLTYPSDKPAQYALEVNQNELDDIKTSCKLKITRELRKLITQSEP